MPEVEDYKRSTGWLQAKADSGKEVQSQKRPGLFVESSA